jgi:hypothetical protein
MAEMTTERRILPGSPVVSAARWLTGEVPKSHPLHSSDIGADDQPARKARLAPCLIAPVDQALRQTPATLPLIDPTDRPGLPTERAMRPQADTTKERRSIARYAAGEWSGVGTPPHGSNLAVPWFDQSVAA